MGVTEDRQGIHYVSVMLHRDATIKDNIITWKQLPYFRTDLSFFFYLIDLKEKPSPNYSMSSRRIFSR